MKLFLNFFFLVLIIFFSSILFFINYYENTEIIKIISILTNSEKNINKISQLFSKNTFIKINLIIILYILILLLLFYYKKTFILLSKNFLNIILHILSELKKFELHYYIYFIILIIPSLIIKIFFLLNMPVSYDEAFTIINFTQKGFFSSIAYYPAPNNHVLYSLITNMFQLLISNELLGNRIINLIIINLFLFFVYFSNIKLFNFKTAIVTTLIVSLIFPVISYGYLGRGYGLIILLSYISFYYFYKIIFLNDKNTNKTLIIISICFFFSVAVNPSNLYLFTIYYIILSIFHLLNNNYNVIIKLTLYFVIITFLLFIFYSPIFIISGFGSVFDNKFVSSSEEINLFDFINHYFIITLSYLYNNLIIFYTLYLFLLFNFIRFKRNKNFLIIFSIFNFLPFIFTLIQDVIAPERVFVFLIPSFIFLLSIIYFNISSNNFKIFYNLIAVLLSLYLFYSSILKVNNFHIFSKIGKNSSQFIINLNPEKIYIKHGLLDTFLIYYSNDNLKMKFGKNDYEKIQNKNEYDYFILNKLTDQKNIKNINYFQMDINNIEYDIYVYKNLNYKM